MPLIGTLKSGFCLNFYAIDEIKLSKCLLGKLCLLRYNDIKVSMYNIIKVLLVGITSNANVARSGKAKV